MIPDLAAMLPAPRDDEPDSLRQDIVDELADHLNCATARELHRTPGERDARHVAITRFGDPAAVARRLWWDAMKGKIMSQRITTLMAMIAAVASMAACGLVWHLVQGSREAQAAVIAAQQESFEALLERLPLSKEDDETRVPEEAWYAVKLRFALGEPGGPPAVGFKTAYIGVSSDPKKFRVIDPRTDENGISMFGANRIGNYSINVRTPWDEEASIRIPVGPNFPTEREIVCPVDGLKPVRLRFQFNEPDELRDAPVTYAIRVEALPREIAGHQWRQAPASLWQLIVSPDGTIRGYSSAGFNSGARQYDTSPTLREYRYSLTSIEVRRNPGNGPQSLSALATYRLPGELLTFEPESGQDNLWEITLPQSFWVEFSKAAREAGLPTTSTTLQSSSDSAFSRNAPLAQPFALQIADQQVFSFYVGLER